MGWLRWPEEFDASSPERHITSRKDGKTRRLTPDEIDREMEACPRSTTVMDLTCLTQAGLEHFVRRYGNTYRSIQISWEGGVKDLSPLADLPQLEHVALFMQRCERLWDMSRNEKLRVLTIDSCRKLTARPSMLETSPALEIVWYLGGPESVHEMTSLDGFANMPAIREIRLKSVRLTDRSTDFLATVPTLAVFDFEAGLFTTEEIARMAAMYPEIGGRFMRAYGPAYYGRKAVFA